MDISVIVATYNQEKTIGRTLESILSQKTDARFEIVIGDDCSTDGTETVCREYAMRYPDKIVYLRREKNLGLVRNYYDCIEHCRGTFIADCAGDDFWVEDTKLHSQWKMMRNDSSVSLVATDWLCCDENGKNPRRYPGHEPIEDVESYERRELLADLFTHTKMIHLCTALYRKDLLMKYIKKSEEIFKGSDNSVEDLQILLAMADSGKIILLPKITLFYCIGEDSVSHHSDFGKQFDYSFKVIRQARKLQQYFEIPPDKLGSFYKDRAAYMCAMVFRSGDENRRKSLLSYLSGYSEGLSLKTRLYLRIMRIPALWRFTRNIINRK